MADVPPEAELEDDGRLLITSEDFYYDTLALPATAPPVLLNDIAAQERVAQETDFQERLHRKIFGEDNLDYTTETRKRRAELLSSKTCAENDVLQFATASEVHQVSLLAAATHCDLCFNFVRSKLGGQCNDARSSIGLDQFSSSSVASFCSILSAYESMLTQQTERTCDVAAAEVTEPPYVTAENVLELLEIMHYLQSTVLLHSLSKFIENKVDTSNCGSILMLADRLALPNLFEASVLHMTSSLDDIKKDGCWEDFPSHLQNRLLTLRAAVCSSILGENGERSDEFSSQF